MTAVALIAGTGALPGQVAAALSRSGVAWVAHHLAGHEPAGLGGSRAFRIERLGSVLADLRKAGIGRACLAGRVARPAIDPALVDAATAPMLARMVEAVRAGDDGALRIVVGFIEEAGLELVAPQELVPTLTMVPEVGTPTARDLADVARARAVLAALGPIDVCQGCVVATGQVLAVEALPGTDWMLASLASSPQRAFPRPEGGVLVKAPKPGQDRRVDLPSIGPDTIRNAARAGLGVVAVERGGVLVLDAAGVDAAARASGLVVHAFDP